MTDPHAYRSAVTPLLVVPDTDAALRFYAEALGAEELFRLTMPDGAVVHAQMLVHGALVMLADENRDHGNLAPTSLGGAPVLMQLTVPDVDAVVARAKASGAEELVPVGDRFYGERAGRIQDPFGHVWIVATVTEKLSTQEMQNRMDEMIAAVAAGDT
ncbi:VOC family protein [Dichotomicrobium thermohalophilum]|uniref:PhnB protein n=1 Tax=Dichotomicrobium thermohalophilum TaxID=933063 RepID=A0A397Q6B1_9HYPH|nr:VOC family protein [Dichotomicrobium thermohalophilum]RIA55345.1 PhnB protein [Dichotomicrobium thermohalophilum]